MIRILSLLTLLVAACSWPTEKSKAIFSDGKKLGTVPKVLEEASGLVASISNPGYLWSHNDSGNPAEVYLIDQKGSIVMTVKLAGITNRDFEDITIGPGPEQGKTYLYIADIGDNLAVYPQKIIYRLEEPVLEGDKKIITNEIDSLVVRLSDAVRDTETLMMDPASKDLFIISKREDSVRLYQIQFPFESDTLLANYQYRMPFHKIVAGDISPDGTEVLLKDYEHIYYWKKKGTESILDLLRTPPIQLPYDREPQGESICWNREATGFYTLSETVKDDRGKLIFYKRN